MGSSFLSLIISLVNRVGKYGFGLLKDIGGWLRKAYEKWAFAVCLPIFFLPVLSYLDPYRILADKNLIIEYDARVQDHYYVHKPWTIADAPTPSPSATAALEAKTQTSQSKTVADWLPPRTANDDPTPRIVVLLVDDEAIRNHPVLASPKPISRRYLARVIQTVARYEPRVIGVDFLLDRASKPEGTDTTLDAVIVPQMDGESADQHKAPKVSDTSLGGEEALAQAILEASAKSFVVLGALPRTKEKSKMEVLPQAQYLGWSAKKKSWQSRASRIWVGEALTGIDAHKEVQRGLLAFVKLQSDPRLPYKKSKVFPTLAYVTAQLACSAQEYSALKSYDQRWWEKAARDDAVETFGWPENLLLEPLLIDFSWRPGRRGPYFACSSEVVFQAQGVEPEVAWTPTNLDQLLRNNIVLIGAAYRDAEDFRLTPLGTPWLGITSGQRALIPGVEVQAYAIATLLRARDKILSSSPSGARTPTEKADLPRLPTVPEEYRMAFLNWWVLAWILGAWLWWLADTGVQRAATNRLRQASRALPIKRKKTYFEAIRAPQPPFPRYALFSLFTVLYLFAFWALSMNDFTPAGVLPPLVRPSILIILGHLMLSLRMPAFGATHKPAKA